MADSDRNQSSVEFEKRSEGISSQPLTVNGLPDQQSSTAVAESPDNFGPAPDGGTKAWLVAAGGCCLFFCCLGFSNAFGVFQEYYQNNQLRGELPDNIAWIGSISTFLQFAAGGVGGPLFDRFGEKVCLTGPC
jgi:hypothetical protein